MLILYLSYTSYLLAVFSQSLTLASPGGLFSACCMAIASACGQLSLAVVTVWYLVDV
jgi:hypothetical protein